MDTVASRNESIEDLNTHLEDGKRRFNLLEQELSNERDNNLLLAQQIETYEIDSAKDKDTLARSVELSQELNFFKRSSKLLMHLSQRNLSHLRKLTSLSKVNL